MTQPFDAPFAGVLFDLDGTLIDSIPAVQRAWASLASEYGFDAALHGRLHGVPAREAVELLLPGREAEWDGALARIADLEVTDTDGIVMLPGARELMEALLAGPVPTAIVTSGTAELAAARMAAAGVPTPHALVTASDVTHGKPHPEPWLLGAQQLGVDASGCIVFEDSPAGLDGALTAGARARVGIATSHTAEALASHADAVIGQLAEVAFEVGDRSVRITPRESLPA